MALYILLQENQIISCLLYFSNLIFFYFLIFEVTIIALEWDGEVVLDLQKDAEVGHVIEKEGEVDHVTGTVEGHATVVHVDHILRKKKSKKK